jgi:hypothetical protein
MNDQTNLERLIEVATKYGYTEGQIVLICDEIGQAAYEQFAQEVERLLSPEDKHSLENMSDELQVRGEMEKLYKEKTGTDAIDTVNGYLSRHIDEFIQDHSGTAAPQAA